MAMTLDQLNTLSDYDLNVLIAKRCGWYEKKVVLSQFKLPQIMWCNDENGFRQRPWPIDYSTDLNEMQKVLQTINPNVMSKYWSNLYTIIEGNRLKLLENNWIVHIATARQRAQAFILTVE